MKPYLTPKAMKETEARFEADARVWQIMDLIVAEWESDPASVQCFDLRIVNEAKELVKKRKAMNDYWNPFRED